MLKSEPQTKLVVAKPPPAERLYVSNVSIVASILSNLIIRIAGRSSFVVLGFYLGEHFNSATLIVVVIESFYISEFLVSPVVGSLSDARGRKPFMLYAPVVGGLATMSLALAAFLFPKPDASVFDFQLVALLLIVLVGRLLEGLANALNAPPSLGYLIDATIGSDRLRTKVVTAFEVASVAGIALGIPFGGQISQLFGTSGFLIITYIYALAFLVIYFFMQESLSREELQSRKGQPISFTGGFRLIISNQRIYSFMPAWLAFNALSGAWLSLITIVLAYPTPSADVRFPGQLLYGGFSPGVASGLVGFYSIWFLLGMIGWTRIMPYIRRTTVMLVGMIGLIVSIATLSFINSLADNPNVLSSQAQTIIYMVLPIQIVAIVLESGFTPALLIQLGAISETLPGQRGAVMGLYSVLMGLGQLLGTFIGGIFIDWNGFYGLMIYSMLLGIIALSSVLYMRYHAYDLIKTNGSE